MSQRSRGWTDLEDIEVDSGSGEKQHRAMPSLVLLGPQRRLPRVAEAVAELGLESACAITAGWQERADEVGELESHLRIPVLRLDLYRRAEHVFEDDPKFFDAYRARQNKLKAQQRVYRLRLNFLMKQCLEVWKLRLAHCGLKRSEVTPLKWCANSIAITSPRLMLSISSSSIGTDLWPGLPFVDSARN